MQGGEVLLINPRSKRDSKGRFIKRHRARRKSTSGRRRRRRNPVAALAANPRRRRRRKNPIALAANPRRRRRVVRASSHRRRRRNPRFALSGTLGNFIAPAFLGGAGALALDVGMSALPIPDQFKSGPLGALAKVAGALALGWGVGKIRSGWGRPVTLGALTVIAYGVTRELAQRFAPTLPGLSDFQDYQVGYIDPAPVLQNQGANPMGAYMQPGMGAYMTPGSDNLNGYADDGM